MADSQSAWQTSLFGMVDGEAAVSFDPDFGSAQRIDLDPASWVDYAPGWVGGSQVLFDILAGVVEWKQRRRRMFDGVLAEPRLTAGWASDSGARLVPEELDDMRAALSERYEVGFDSVGLNLYRNGHDSVAWHGDRIDRTIAEPVVALVSLGEPRPFLLRPKGGGRSRRFLLGGGDLLVTGGRCQREWQHSVPKVASAGPRISIAFRHGMYRAQLPR